VHRRIRPAGSLGLPAVVFWVLLSGCASDESAQHDIAQLRQDLNAVNLAVHRSKGETDTVVGQLDRRTREQAAENTKQLQTLSARFDSLTAELNSLSARLDELAQRLDTLSRPAGGGSPPRPSPPPAPTLSPSGGGRSSGGPSAEESYKAAYLDFSKGNYSLAIASFREFVRRFPDAPQADGAQYWIGESYVASAHAAATQGQADKAKEALQQAVQEYRKVFVNYPRGAQVPTALYKEALALEELKQVKLAQARLQYLVENFPQSQEAPLARERLKSLGE
jgi:TolA-binding protein